MKKIRSIIYLSILILFLLIIPANTGVKTVGVTPLKTMVLNEMLKTSGHILSIDTIISDIIVKYYEHYENNALVKNDSILLHIDPKTDDILLYQKNWDEVSVNTSAFFKKDLNITDYFWKQLVIFPSKKDCGSFYTLSDQIAYPVICWEVHYRNGHTILYNKISEIIGKGVCAPVEGGFSLNGWDQSLGINTWREWRESADKWFRRWCDFRYTEANPSVETISSYISNQDIHYFFELAHGDSYQFQPNSDEQYRSYLVSNEMYERQPMKFAFIGSCGGMDSTEKGSFSYAFRKGETYGSVTIGYSGMAYSPGWSVSLPWQETLFENVNEGKTWKESFDIACSLWPTIAEAVRFKGDENLTLGNYPPSPPKINGTFVGEANTQYSFILYSYDPEAEDIYYMVDWDDGNFIDWTGPFSYHENPTFTHSWSKNGIYSIKFRSKDVYSLTSESITEISITSAPLKPHRPTGPRTGKNSTICRYSTSCVDPDNDMVFYLWDWGDGTNTKWIGPYVSGETCSWTHIWQKEGEYEITVKAKDEHGIESDWSDPIHVSMPKSKPFPNYFQRFLTQHPRIFPLLQKLFFEI